MASLYSHLTSTAQRAWSLIKWKPSVLTELYERESDPRARFLAYTVLYSLMAYLCAVLTFIDASSLCEGPPSTVRISVNGVPKESYTICKANDAATEKYIRFVYSVRQPVPDWLIPPPEMFYAVWVFFQILHRWEYPLGRYRSHRLRSGYNFGVQVATGTVVQQFLMAGIHNWRTLLCVVVPWKMLLDSMLGTLLHCCGGERLLKEEPAEGESNGGGHGDRSSRPEEAPGVEEKAGSRVGASMG